MGLFDFFRSEDDRIRRQQRRVTDRNIQPEDREAASRWLADNGSGKALLALLSRFDVNLENQLKDSSEKEFVYGLLLQKGDALEAPLRAHLKRCRQIALPIRLFEELRGEKATIELVFELLRIELEKDDFKPAKKTHLLVWLAERRHPDAIEQAAPFLRDFDEGVRYAAAEILAGQSSDAARPHLLAVLANPSEESNRLRVRIAEIFAQRRWPVDDADLEGRLVGGYTVRDGRIVSP